MFSCSLSVFSFFLAVTWVVGFWMSWTVIGMLRSVAKLMISGMSKTGNVSPSPSSIFDLVQIFGIAFVVCCFCCWEFCLFFWAGFSKLTFFRFFSFITTKKNCSDCIPTKLWMWAHCTLWLNSCLFVFVFVFVLFFFFKPFNVIFCFVSDATFSQTSITRRTIAGWLDEKRRKKTNLAKKKNKAEKWPQQTKLKSYSKMKIKATKTKQKKVGERRWWWYFFLCWLWFRAPWLNLVHHTSSWTLVCFCWLIWLHVFHFFLHHNSQTTRTQIHPQHLQVQFLRLFYLNKSTQ